LCIKTYILSFLGTIYSSSVYFQSKTEDIPLKGKPQTCWFSLGKQEATAIAQEVGSTRRLEQATGEQDQQFTELAAMSALWREKVKITMARKL
jgi:hypothetical protein